jgi:hypothetical protein
MNQCLGLFGSLTVWTAVVVVAAVVAGYLFLRANPRKKTKLDAAVAKIKDIVK